MNEGNLFFRLYPSQFVLYFAILIALSNPAQVLAAEIKIGGGAAPINNIFKRIKAAFEASSKHKLVLSEQGPDIALIELDQGKIDLAAAGLPFGDWIKLVEDKKHKFINSKDDIKARVIGRDVIQVYVNPDVTVSELNADQLHDLFTGRAKNWKTVGGSDMPVVVVLGEKIPGTNKVWQKEILKDAPWAVGAKKVGTAADIAQEVAKTRGAVGIGPIGLETREVPIRTVKSPVVGRPILAATIGVPKPEILELYDFIVKQGKDYTKE